MSNIRKAVAGSAAFATLWAVVAIISPNTTFHLGPLIVAGSPALVSQRRTATRAAPAALSIALGTSLILAAGGWLRGPSLLPWGGSLAESLLFAVVGAAVALAAGGRPTESLST